MIEYSALLESRILEVYFFCQCRTINKAVVTVAIALPSQNFTSDRLQLGSKDVSSWGSVVCQP